MKRRTFLENSLLASASLSVLPSGPLSQKTPSFPEEKFASSPYQSNWYDLPDRVWIGENLWGNRLQDWHLHDGGLQCNVRGRNRSVARSDVKRWKDETGKPYGVYGITFPGVYSDDPKQVVEANPLDVELLNAAAFVFFRDSISLDLAKKLGVRNPVMEFCPDGAFAVDLKDDAAATAFMKEHGLEEGRFMCVIPRNRLTPWWEIPSKNRALDEKKNARNELMREHDNAPLRKAIIAVVRQTPMKILICPENETQVKLGKQILLDKLPEDVKEKVVWRDRYWLTDEAVSTYVRSAGIFGLEMHSPIMCIGHGIPAIVGRFAEQTSKGFMWSDIGLDDWLFDFDNEADIARYVPAVLAMAQDPKAARQYAAKGKAFVEKRQRETMAVLGKKLASEK